MPRLRISSSLGARHLLEAFTQEVTHAASHSPTNQKASVPTSCFPTGRYPLGPTFWKHLSRKSRMPLDTSAGSGGCGSCGLFANIQT